MWDTNTAAQSMTVFEVGGVRACAEAIEFGKHRGTDEYRWCKDIELTLIDGASLMSGFRFSATAAVFVVRSSIDPSLC